MLTAWRANPLNEDPNKGSSRRRRRGAETQPRATVNLTSPRRAGRVAGSNSGTTSGRPPAPEGEPRRGRDSCYDEAHDSAPPEQPKTRHGPDVGLGVHGQIGRATTSEALSMRVRADVGRRLERSGRVVPESGVGGAAERADERIESWVGLHRGASGCGDVPFNFLARPRKHHIWW